MLKSEPWVHSRHYAIYDICLLYFWVTITLKLLKMFLGFKPPPKKKTTTNFGELINLGLNLIVFIGYLLKSTTVICVL